MLMLARSIQSRSRSRLPGSSGIATAMTRVFLKRYPASRSSPHAFSVSDTSMRMMPNSALSFVTNEWMLMPPPARMRVMALMAPFRFSA